MRKNRLDSVVDELGRRRSLFKQAAQKQFKGTNPYRQEPIPDEERIQDYLQWMGTPMEDELRKQVGDAQVEQIHTSMRDLINKRVMRNA